MANTGVEQESNCFHFYYQKRIIRDRFIHIYSPIYFSFKNILEFIDTPLVIPGQSYCFQTFFSLS